jgi:hypothetical protein
MRFKVFPSDILYLPLEEMTFKRFLVNLQSVFHIFKQ